MVRYAPDKIDEDDLHVRIFFPMIIYEEDLLLE